MEYDVAVAKTRPNQQPFPGVRRLPPWPCGSPGIFYGRYVPLPNRAGPLFSVYSEDIHNNQEQLAAKVHRRKALSVAHATLVTMGAKCGLVLRVIIVDSQDQIAFEWTFERGVIKPMLMSLRSHVSKPPVTPVPQSIDIGK